MLRAKLNSNIERKQPILNTSATKYLPQTNDIISLDFAKNKAMQSKAKTINLKLFTMQTRKK